MYSVYMKVDLFFLTRRPNAVQLYMAISMSDVAMVETPGYGPQ